MVTPASNRAENTFALWPALFVAALSLAVYLKTLCPTIFVGDSGELAAAAATLGIAHPPGYPLWVLLGHWPALLSPHEPALGLNVLSALCGATAAAMLTGFLFRLRVTALASISAGLAYAFAVGPWSQSVITEVYALNMALSASILWAAVAGHEGRAWGYPVAALLLGLGLGNHPLVLLTGLPLLLWWVHTRRADSKRAPFLAPLLLFVLGASVYLYIPLRQAQNPLIEWGGMHGLQDVLNHLFRQQYGEPFAHEGVASLEKRLLVFAQLFLQDVPPLACALAVAGLLALRRADRRTLVLGILGLWLVSGPVLAGSLDFQDSFRDRTVVKVYFLGADLAAYLLAGIGLAEILEFLRASFAAHWRVLWGVAAVLTAGAVLLEGWTNYPVCDRSRSTLARDYADTVLRSLPKGARLYANAGDAEVFSLIYEHEVKGVRPDVILHDSYLNLLVRNYGEDFVAMDRSQRKAKRVEREIQFALDEPERTIFYTERASTEGFAGCTMVPNHMIFQLLRPSEKPAQISATIDSFPPVDSDDCLESVLAASIQYRTGLWAQAYRDREQARPYFESARSYGIKSADIQVVVGEAFARLGDETSAWECLHRALALNPTDSAALYAIANLQLANGKESDALRTLRELDKLKVPAPEVYMQYGTLLALQGEFPSAIRAAQRALSLDSSLDAAKTLLDLAREGESLGKSKGVAAIRDRVENLRVDWTLQAARLQLEKGEYQRARDLFERALRAAPDDSRVLYGMGYTLLENQSFEEAARVFKRMLKLDPNSVNGINALAYTEAVMGVHLQEAKRSVLSVLPDSKDLHPYLLDTLGWICYREDDPSEALSYLQRAEGELPQADRSMRAENHFHIAATLSRLGRKEEARRYLGLALQEASGEFWEPELKALQKRLEE